ncbi:MAG TPA: exonuclease domain-containing protein, partial [Flavobacterium sp.]|nr:exonuclease domain-containing protein [Flavobacterium sp.]
LINPEIPIQPFVVQLTGINNTMLRSAPKFFEVAKRIIEITNDCVLVAHNALFDYRILRTEFRRLGYDFQMHTLCTVELAQKLIPEQPSYSLGKLVRALGIPMADRHRANGDALATVKLFQLLLSKDIEKTILKELIKTEVEKGLEPKLLDIVESLPSKTGIYYVHKEDGSIIHIGRSKNIKKSINQHFTSTLRLSKQIQADVFTVSFEETGSELIAMLKEREEIIVNKPPLNKFPKKRNFPWGVFTHRDNSGLMMLKVRKVGGPDKPVISCVSEQDAHFHIASAVQQYELYEAPVTVETTENDIDAFPESWIEEHNQRYGQFISRTCVENRSVIIIDRGRKISERSAILIENGVLKGIAYFDLNYQLTNADILHNILVPMHHSREVMHMIQAYLRKSKHHKIVSLENT